MYFEISFKDIVNAIKKVIEDHPGATIATIASIVAGYLVYLCYQKATDYPHAFNVPELEDETGVPTVNKPPINHKQKRRLRIYPKPGWSTTPASEDGERFVASMKPNDIPLEIEAEDNVEQRQSVPFNCWSWAINPISGKLNYSLPAGIDSTRGRYDIRTLKEATNMYLKRMLTQNLILNYKEVVGNNKSVLDFMKNESLALNQRLVIGLRVGIYDADFHYIRWYLGEWSAKVGTTLGVVKDKTTSATFSFEPDSMWAASVKPSEPTRVQFPRKADGSIQQESVYASPTVYYLVTLPSQG